MTGSTKPADGSPPVAVDDARSRERLSDSLAGDIVLRHVAGRRVLDLGQGRPEITRWVRERVIGGNMVEVDRRELEGPDGLPRPLGEDDETFETLYCLGTLPHLGQDAESSELLARHALEELRRLAVPGGTILVDFANPRSLAGLAAGIRNPSTVVTTRKMVVADEIQLTRYDTLRSFLRMLPPDLELVEVHGLNVLAPWTSALRLPLVGRLLQAAEWWARDGTILRYFGAHLLVVMRRIEDRALPGMAEVPGLGALEPGPVPGVGPAKLPPGE